MTSSANKLARAGTTSTSGESRADLFAPFFRCSAPEQVELLEVFARVDRDAVCEIMRAALDSGDDALLARIWSVLSDADRRQLCRALSAADRELV